jgi:signal recognition particle subunit SRP54
MLLIPRLDSVADLPHVADAEKEMRRLAGMIDSMTREERRRPDLVKGSRRKRIAGGAGVEPYTVQTMIRQFAEMQRLMGRMRRMRTG